MKAKRTLILLAADHDIRLLYAQSPKAGIVELKHLTNEDFSDVDVTFSDRPARMQGQGGARHVSDPRQTEAEQERARMVAHVIDALAAEWAQGYDQLVISAPDKMLGLLRKALPAQIKAHLLADLDKNLIKVAVRDLPDHLKDVLPL